MLSLPAPALAAINHLLDQASWARERLTPFAGHVARISVPPFDAAFAVLADGRLGAAADDAEPEVTISLPATAPLLALQGHEVLMRSARLDGAADFAEALGFVVRHLRWDVEEDLARAVGDIAAHRLMATAQGVAAWQQQAGRNLAENLTEYLTEEQPLIARRVDISSFAADIDCLRDDLARLEKRIRNLAGKPA